MSRILLLSLVFLLSSCASLMSFSNYPVKITSEPSGADFTVKDHLGQILYEGRTPELLNLDASGTYFSRARYSFEFSKEGYKTNIVSFDAKIDKFYYFNLVMDLLTVFPTGTAIVDPVTGAMFCLDYSLSTQLEKAKETY